MDQNSQIPIAATLCNLLPPLCYDIKEFSVNVYVGFDLGDIKAVLRGHFGVCLPLPQPYRF